MCLQAGRGLNWPVAGSEGAVIHSNLTSVTADTGSQGSRTLC